MPYLTTKKNLKLQLSPGLVTSYDIQPGNGVGFFLGHNTHPRPTRGDERQQLRFTMFARNQKAAFHCSLDKLIMATKFV